MSSSRDNGQGGQILSKTGRRAKRHAWDSGRDVGSGGLAGAPGNVCRALCDGARRLPPTVPLVSGGTNAAQAGAEATAALSVNGALP